MRPAALIPLDPFAHMTLRTGRLGPPECVGLDDDLRSTLAARDGDGCRHCGVVPSDDGWDDPLAAHHLDHDHGNEALANLALACRQCHAVHHASTLGLTGRARIVHVPEMTQVSLSGLFRALAQPPSVTARGEGTPRPRVPGLAAYALGREGVRAAFAARARSAVAILGTDDPAELHEALARLPPGFDRRERLSPFRIWLLSPDAARAP